MRGGGRGEVRSWQVMMQSEVRLQDELGRTLRDDVRVDVGFLGDDGVVRLKRTKIDSDMIVRI